ncbi:hypothetical protein KV205_35545 [Streptomyces sp. SKN60]|uniref:hypothetical protein n=1 Tax=Streptomyces sp. SKN60 TaxID=2855506 RepID=UPI0022471F9B|nr:hypothetical protein [Streptomyces sp. SKN60]MCX2185779.1 hypothetical protein [Streptomyces sp. SKN60]
MYSEATGSADIANRELLRLSSRQILRALARLRYAPKPPDSLGRYYLQTLHETIRLRLADVTDGASASAWLVQVLRRIDEGSADAHDYARWAAAGSRAMSGVLEAVEPGSLLPYLSIHVVADQIHSRIAGALEPIATALAKSPESRVRFAGRHR